MTRQFYNEVYTQQQQDIIYGELEEDRLMDILNEKWNTNLRRVGSSSILDFITGNNEYYVEIKSRRNKHNQYPTTMIGYNKIAYIKKHNLNCVFVFAFTDGDYYYTYNDNDNFTIATGGREDRGKQEFNKYYYIPIEKLNKL